jgi:hypothetical protein
VCASIKRKKKPAWKTDLINIIYWGVYSLAIGASSCNPNSPWFKSQYCFLTLKLRWPPTERSSTCWLWTLTSQWPHEWRHAKGTGAFTKMTTYREVIYLLSVDSDITVTS